jgi:hypothetical protein
LLVIKLLPPAARLARILFVQTPGYTTILLQSGVVQRFPLLLDIVAEAAAARRGVGEHGRIGGGQEEEEEESIL